MAWYPGAKKMELQPESDDQPAIRPTQFILHSIVAPWTPERTYEYWRDSTNLESHFGLGYDGSLGQFIGTETRADANAAANRRADGTGAVSLESASNTKASDPWTDAQVESIIKLGVWLHQKHGIPLRACRNASDPGFGYHRMFSAWNPDAHACPGDARVEQFHKVVLPGIVARATGQTSNPPEETVALTDADIAKFFSQDGTVPAARPPVNNSDYDTNKTWTAAYTLQTITEGVRKAQQQIGGVADDVATIKTAVASLTTGGIDLDALAAKVAGSQALIDAIASKVAADLAARLAE